MSLNLFSTLPGFVTDELNRRRFGKSGEKNGVYNDEKPGGIQKPKSPWMRMISNFKKSGDDTRRVLVGGDIGMNEKIKFGFENLYEKQGVDDEGNTTGEKYRPKPTLTGITIDEQLQSFECTVEWTAHSMAQLERLFPYFMNLGTSVIVDWGWDSAPPDGIIDPNDKKQIRNQFASLNSDMSSEVSSSNTESAKDSSSKRVFDHPKYSRMEAANGKYSLAAGAITNFSFSPEGDGSYSCTTEILSLSKAMEKLRTSNQKNEKSTPKSENPNSDRKTVPAVQEFLDGWFTKYLKENAEKKGNIVEVKQTEKTDYLENTEDKQGYYVSWEFIERLTNVYGSNVKNEGSKKETRTVKMDSSDSVISSYDPGKEDIFLKTLDPLTCIVDVKGNSDRFRKFGSASNSDKIKREIDDPKKQGFLYNLYVEHQLLIVAFETNETVQEALKYILDRCSAACFGIWEFELIAKGNTIQVIDRNMPENTVKTVLNGQDGGDFTFRPDTQDSVMRDFSFDTNLDDRMKGMIVSQKNFGSSSQGGQSTQSLRSGGKPPKRNAKKDSLVNLFGNEFDGEDIAIGGMSNPKDAEAKNDGEFASTKKVRSRYLSPMHIEGDVDNQLKNLTKDDYETARKKAVKTNTVLGQQFKGLVYSGDGESTYAAKFDRYLHGDKGEKSPLNSNNIVNINGQIELDGIGGVTAYQVLDIKNIPRVFDNTGVFMVKKISHSVSIDDWSTELKIMLLVQNQEEK